MIRKTIVGVLAVAGVAASSPSLAADTLRIGLIEPLSGPIAAIGQDALNSFKYAAEHASRRHGVKIEIVGLDNAMNAEKTTQQLKKAVDMGLGFVAQGIGSNHALNIIKFVNKHNKRNPGKPLVYLNHSSITTAFTNELCSFWHFRFDANVDMKVAALVTQMGRDPSIKKVYMLNQNYAYGKSFQAAARRLLAKRASRVELVGDELMVPFGKVQDFTPFIAKIKNAGADTILTGNWGPDLVRFVKAAVGSGLDARFYTVYGGISSSIAGFGEDAKKVDLKQVTEMHENENLSDDLREFMKGFLDTYEDTWYSDRYRWTMEMVGAAAKKAGSTDPIAVAKALEGLTFEGPFGTVQMRASDHQIQLPLLISSLTEDAAHKYIYKGENFGVAFRTDGIVSRLETSLPTTCKMKRPK